MLFIQHFLYFILLITFSISTILVDTPCGIYQGIPYAKPPINELRFKIPERVECKPKTVISPNPNICIQFQIPWDPIYTQSEDCLSIDVYSSNIKNNNKLLPTIAWIYGGSNVFGSTRSYLGLDSIAATDEVCLISMNYRVNVFGYFAHSSFSSQDVRGTSGNYGIEDQILALKWIKENAEYFGCDPNQVTLLGQSSGGTNIMALLSSSKNIGLFTGAISLSGSLNFSMDKATAENQGAAIVSSSPCNNIDDIVSCMQSLPVSEVIAATPVSWASTDFWPTSPTGLANPGLPYVDGYTIEMSFKEAMTVALVDVPMILQSVKNEMEVFGTGADIFSLNWDQYQQYLTSNFASFPFGTQTGQYIENYYSSSANITSVISSYYELLADINNYCGNVESGLLFSAVSTTPCYVGLMYQPPNVPAGNIEQGAPLVVDPFHLWDYILATRSYNFLSSCLPYIEPIIPSSNEIMLGNEILSMWIEFAKYGRLSSFNPIIYPNINGDYSVIQLGDLDKSGKVYNSVNLKDSQCSLLKKLGLRPDERFYLVN